jgi:hypothetical protein
MKTIILFISSLLISSSAFSLNETWRQIANEDNIEIFSKSPINGVIPFKANGEINANISTILAILKDHSKKHEWAPKLEKVTLHKKLAKDQFVFSEYYKTPWPATDREFLLLGTIEQVNDNSIILRAHSIDQEKEFKGYISNDHVQADVQYINVRLDSISNYKTQITFEFHGDMKGWMPNWLMNLIQKKWPLRFIQGLRKYSGGEKLQLSLNTRK